MNKIVRKEQFSEKVFLFEIEAPLIAKSRKAGNFVIVRVGKKGERMPLTIAAADIEKGTITLRIRLPAAFRAWMIGNMGATPRPPPAQTTVP